MTLSVNAIRNYSPMNYSRNNLKTKEALKAQPAFEGRKSNAMRNTAMAVLVGSTMFPLVTSCDKDDWFNHSEAWAYAKSDCNCHYINGRDTIYFPVPGKKDTITQIVEVHDTVKIKDDFKSPVIDTINVILNDLDIDKGNGYIPLKISFIDEMDTGYKKYLFDGEMSSPNLVVYRGTVSPFDDNSGQFIIGTPADKREIYQASLTGDGKLYLQKWVAKEYVMDPKGLNDFKPTSQALVLERDQANKLIRRFAEYSDKNGREDLGTMEKGELPKTIKITNPYGTTWRYTNVDVVSGDAPHGQN